MANLTTLASGSSVVLTVTEQQSIVLNNGRTDVARLQITTGPGAGSVVTASHNGRRVYGPFGAGTITLSAVSGDVRYELSGDSTSPLDDDGQPLTATENQTVRALVSQDGILPRADTLFAVEKVQMTASGSPCAAPCLLHRIRCLVGTSIALVVYDNPFGTSGTQLYSGTLSAGEEAVISGAPVRAINGPRGVFTGTATFEYHVSQEV